MFGGARCAVLRTPLRGARCFSKSAVGCKNVKWSVLLYLEMPLADLCQAVAADEVRGRGLHQLPPVLHVVGGHLEALVAAVVREDVVARPVELRGRATRHEGAGREGELHNRLHAELYEKVEDLVDVVLTGAQTGATRGHQRQNRRSASQRAVVSSEPGSDGRTVSMMGAVAGR